MWIEIVPHQYPLFFMTDRVDSEGLTIRYCPTDIMLADFFTKALQGNLFRKFKDIILGYLHTKSLLTDMSSSPEERVGKQVKCDSASGQILKPTLSWADVVKNKGQTKLS